MNEINPTATGIWLREWFSYRGKFKSQEIFENIDSMGVIELICDVEKHFGIKFTERDFQNRKFSTIEGLAEIIRHKKDRG